MGLIPTRGSNIVLVMKEKDTVVDVLVCRTMREVVNAINSNSLTKENIIQVIKGNSEWYLLYQRNA